MSLIDLCSRYTVGEQTQAATWPHLTIMCKAPVIESTSHIQVSMPNCIANQITSAWQQGLVERWWRVFESSSYIVQKEVLHINPLECRSKRTPLISYFCWVVEKMWEHYYYLSLDNKWLFWFLSWFSSLIWRVCSCNQVLLTVHWTCVYTETIIFPICFHQDQ